MMKRSQPRRQRARRRLVVALVVGLAAAFLPLSLVVRAGPADPSGAWAFYKVDPHVHSVVSGDATNDLGILAHAAGAAGYNALFVTDHQAGSYYPIGGAVAAHVGFDDDLTQWEAAAAGTPTGSIDTLASAPALSGTHSLHLATTAGDYAENFQWTKRGPNLRSGDVILRFSVYPTRIDPGSGLYVSVSLGGDDSIPDRGADGYTTADGVVSPNKSTVLVWQLGEPRASSADPHQRVVTTPLAYTLNQWNSYTVNLSQAVTELVPAADRPMDYNAFLMLKMAAGASRGGTAEGYFDAYTIDATGPVPSKAQGAAAEFVHRNSLISNYDTPALKLFPAMEMGFNDHAQRLVFPINSTSQWQQFSKGVGGIPTVQASGYPAMLNHPGLPGGVTDAEAIESSAYGADVVETVERGNNDVMIRDWDAILRQGQPLIGAWSSDAHRTDKLFRATHVYSPALTVDELLHSFFEGRQFMADVDFPGRLSFNLDSGSPAPYPARYPLYVGETQDTVPVHLAVTGVQAGDTVSWVRNGEPWVSDTVTGRSYEDTKGVPLVGAFTYVRAEVRRAGLREGVRAAMSEPIFFVHVAGMPRGVNVGIDRVTTPDGQGYTKTMTKGITSASWDSTAQRYAVALDNRPGSLVELASGTGAYDVSGVTVDGEVVVPAPSPTAFDAATGNSWVYDAATHRLRVKALQGPGPTTAVVSFLPGTDTQAPTTPLVSAIADHARQVTLHWSASADDVGVTGYTLRRNGAVIASVGAGTVSYVDASASPATDYSYEVRAEDSAANQSARGTATVATPALTTTRLTPMADSYISAASWNSNYGTSTALRLDGSPVLSGYLRFELPTLSGAVLSTRLRLFANSTAGAGHQVRTVEDTSWGERTIMAANAPLLGAVVSTSGAVKAGTWSSAGLPPALSRSGLLSLGLTTPGTTSISYATRESGASAPQLVIETSPTAPTAGPVSVTSAEDTPATWTPPAADIDGDSLTCALVGPPAQGTATVTADCSSGTYTPNPDANGPDSFTYSVSDGSTTVTGTVAVTVTPVNDPPAVDDETGGASVVEDTPTTLEIFADDVDGDCPLAFTVRRAPTHGTVGAPGTPSCTDGSASAPLVYTPAADYHGSDTFTYQVSDLTGVVSEVGTVNLTVLPVNDAPAADPAHASAWPGTLTPLTLSAGDVDGDCPLAFAVVTGPAHGMLGSLSEPTCTGGVASARVTYTADPSFDGTDSFAYRVSDPSAAQSTASASVTVLPALFSDGFESGDLARWPTRAGVAVQSTTVSAGTYAAEVQATTGNAYFRHPLSSAVASLSFRARIRLVTRPPSGTAAVLRLRTGTASIITLSLDSGGRLRVRNDVTKAVTASTTALTAGKWADLELRATVNGTSSSFDVLLDGTPVPGLSAVDIDLGMAGVQAVQIGENNPAGAYHFFVDDVLVNRR